MVQVETCIITQGKLKRSTSSTFCIYALHKFIILRLVREKLGKVLEMYKSYIEEVFSMSDEVVAQNFYFIL